MTCPNSNLSDQILTDDSMPKLTKEGLDEALAKFWDRSGNKHVDPKICDITSKTKYIF